MNIPFYQKGNPIAEIRLSYDPLISSRGFSLLVKRRPYIETASWWLRWPLSSEIVCHHTFRRQSVPYFDITNYSGIEIPIIEIKWCIWILMITIRRPRDHLIFIMGIRYWWDAIFISNAPRHISVDTIILDNVEKERKFWLDFISLTI